MSNVNKIASAAFRLANAHGHEWATYVDYASRRLVADEMFTCDGHVNPAHLEWAEAEAIKNPGPCGGLGASNSHVTGTGRLMWGVQLFADEQLVNLEIRRPADIVGGIGGITVLRVQLWCNHTGEAYEVLEVQTSRLAEKRHWEVLFEACQLLGVGNHDGTGDLFDQCLTAICGHTNWNAALEGGQVRDIHFWVPRNAYADAASYGAQVCEPTECPETGLLTWPADQERVSLDTVTWCPNSNKFCGWAGNGKTVAEWEQL